MGKKRIEDLANKYAVCARKKAKMLITNRKLTLSVCCIMDKIHVNFHGEKRELSD